MAHISRYFTTLALVNLYVFFYNFFTNLNIEKSVNLTTVVLQPKHARIDISLI